MTADQLCGFTVAAVVIMLMIGAFVLMKPGDQKPPRDLPASQNPIPQPEPGQRARKNIMSKQPVVLTFDAKSIDMSKYNPNNDFDLAQSAQDLRAALGANDFTFELWSDWYRTSAASPATMWGTTELYRVWNVMKQPGKNSFEALAEDMNDAVYKPAKGYYGKPRDDGTSAIQILNQALSIQEQRARDYDQPGGERSMMATVQAFNIITRRNGAHALTESEGWLLMQILKDVRDRSTAKPHADSLLDGVSYSSLKAEARLKEVAAEPSDAEVEVALGAAVTMAKKLDVALDAKPVPKITPYESENDDVMDRNVVMQLLRLVRKHCKDDGSKVKRIIKEGGGVEKIADVKNEDIRCVGILASMWLDGYELARKNEVDL